MKPNIAILSFLLLSVAFAAACTDSDGGLNFTVQGTTGGAPMPGTNLYNATDYCLNSTTLVEYYCAQGAGQIYIGTYLENCSGACSDGACTGKTHTPPSPIGPAELTNLSVPVGQPSGCNTTVYVGDVLTAQGYAIRLDSISEADNGTAVGTISVLFNGFSIWSGQIAEAGTYSFTNPLDGTEITINDCQNVPGADGFAKVAITGIDFTLVPAAPRPLPMPSPSGAANITIPKDKNVSAEITIYTLGPQNGQKISLPLGETVPAGDYNLRLVGAPSSGTASVEVSDSQGNGLGTYDISTGSLYDVPVAPGASPLQLVLQKIAGAEGLGTQAGAQAGTEEALSPEEAAKRQQASNMESLIAMLVIFIGMVIASFLVLHYLQRGAVEDSAMKLFENETRAGIMKQLSEADRIPTDLANSLDKSKAAVSEHLDTLVQAGLVERIETPGRKFVYYRLTQKGRQALLRMAG